MKLARTEVIALANQKGGCGKTTTAVNLAAALAEAEYDVCLIDLDAQCNATENLGFDLDDHESKGRFTVIDAFASKKAAREIAYLLENRAGGHLSVVPGSRGVSAVPHKLDAQARADRDGSELDADDMKDEQRLRLKLSIDSLRGLYDFVIIDTPPELGFIMTSGLIAADSYIIPVTPSGYDLKGLEKLDRNVKKVKQRYNRGLRLLGVLVGRYDARTKLDADIARMLRDSFGEEFVFRTIIRQSAKLRQSTVYGQTIFEHSDIDKAAEGFAALAKEVAEKISAAEPIEAPPAEGAGEGAPPVAVAPEEGASELMEANRG
jgi:chromosome partitioning protein